MSDKTKMYSAMTDDELCQLLAKDSYIDDGRFVQEGLLIVNTDEGRLFRLHVDQLVKDHEKRMNSYKKHCHDVRENAFGFDEPSLPPPPKPHPLIKRYENAMANAYAIAQNNRVRTLRVTEKQENTCMDSEKCSYLTHHILATSVLFMTAAVAQYVTTPRETLS